MGICLICVLFNNYATKTLILPCKNTNVCVQFCNLHKILHHADIFKVKVKKQVFTFTFPANQNKLEWILNWRNEVQIPEQ